ncbi:Hypothetical predicted protein [Mytilus galloprovincialis]|uniref:Uncharacterized protein n=1 Tax=Mytilus galloprovincialis TaxID=29158 RepID=A0A8B6CT56_MYTGA|nr:Hypothetical predicted protein [Mytilus galloprovincialis]VDI57485.1 Hypothetical predicted protein [Mytilus galloprovincialis]
MAAIENDYIGAQVQISNPKPFLKTNVAIPIPVDGRVKITGCQVLPDGQFLLLDQINRRLMHFNTDGVHTRDIITFTGIPFDICLFGDQTVVVSILDKNQILVVDIGNSLIIKSFLLEGSCYGLDSDGETLIVRLQDKDIVIITDIDGSIQIKVQIPGYYLIRVAFSQDKIYSTNVNENTVSCYTREGQNIWSIRNNDIHRPYDLSVDKNGMVYVACNSKNTVVAISPDGTSSRVVLSAKDGLDKPYAVHMDKESSTLLVCNEDNARAFVYSIRT